MCVESQGLGKFSSICVLLKIRVNGGNVKIFNSLHNCISTLRLLITETIVSNLNQKHSRPVLFERDFKLSNCSCKVNFTNLSCNYTRDLSATILFKLVHSYLITFKFAQ